MVQSHLIQRGKIYHFVHRIPADLKHRFPMNTIWKSLKTKDRKQARTLANAEEYRIQQLFIHLRCGMLSRELENRLVASYLLRGAARIESEITGTPYDASELPITSIDNIFDDIHSSELRGRRLAEKTLGANGIEPSILREILPEQLKMDAEAYRTVLSERNELGALDVGDFVAEKLKAAQGLKLNNADKTKIGFKLIEANIQLREAESAALNGHWQALRLIKNNSLELIKESYHPLQELAKKYIEWHRTDKPEKLTRHKALSAEVAVLLDIFGNMSVNEFNSMDSVGKLKSILNKYPVNKTIKFSSKSIHTILKTERNYAIIENATKNKYIKLASAMVNFALESRMITTSNVYLRKVYKLNATPEEQRPAYDNNDIVRLIDAICSKPLWTYNPPKPERFWLILILLFHGMNPSSIVALTKADIQQENGLWVFNFRKGKNIFRKRPVAICDTLQLLGFLDWVQALGRDKLFQDTSRNFSNWYNMSASTSGFERHVTDDIHKCLYSIRHTFAVNVFDVTDDYKRTADMMGHSTGGSMTARYTKVSKATAMKEISDKMKLDNIDLNRLEARAKELFGLP